MINTSLRALKPAAMVLLLAAVPAHAQEQASSGVSGRLEALERDTSNFFGQIFGGSERFGRNEAPVPAKPAQMAQASPPELLLRLDRLENQIRQLTGVIEQLQFRNQQLEQQVRRMQETGAPAPLARPQTMPAQPVGPAGPSSPPQRRSDVDQNEYPFIPGGSRSFPRRSDVFDPAENPTAPGASRPMQRRSDVFDPTENPNAPGAPRVLGSIPTGPTVVTGDPDEPAAGPPIGVPGGRQAGAPLDLSTLSGHAAGDPALAAPGSVPPGGALPPPPPRTPSATGPFQQQAMAPATATPKEEYDLAYGYLVRKDYTVAEEGFRNFLNRHPSDRLVAEANYWLGESLFQRQRYRDAAESFLTVSTKFEKSSKAPDALVRLGQSLAALKEKEAACATFLEVGRKYPRAAPNVKQSVEREQKRAGC
jgi:tol-pal system protein YbgF